MINRGKVIIIPNEDEILLDKFERDVEMGKSHTYRIQEFSDMFMLGYHFTEEDYQLAPCEIASQGHLVIKMLEEGSIAIVYLSEIITDRQYQWLYSNVETLSKYIVIDAFSLTYDDQNLPVWEEVEGLNEIMMNARMKNMLYKKGLKK